MDSTSSEIYLINTDGTDATRLTHNHIAEVISVRDHGSPRPYEYANRYGVRYLAWEEVAGLSQGPAEMLQNDAPQLVVGILRAGVFPAFVVSAALCCELSVAGISRRVRREVTFEHPVWRVLVSPIVAGKVIFVVDEIADTGETLTLVRDSVGDHGAARVITAALVAHSWAEPQPDLVSLVSDEFVVFPWDAQILDNGRWVRDPEVEAGIQAQHPHDK